MVPGLSASSSSTTPSPTPSSSSSQDSVFDVNGYTENPLPDGNGSTNEELRGDPLHEFTKAENKNKNGESEEAQRKISYELPGWQQEFREKLVDESSLLSAYTQVKCKMENAPKLLKFKSECPDIRIRLPRHEWPKSWSRSYLRKSH